MIQKATALSYLSDEYKILQDKIDKIGAFRYTIKGWSVTAVVGGLIASAAGKGRPAVIVGVVLNVCLFSFFWFEREQVILRSKFGSRALKIETKIDSARRIHQWKSQISSPRIARSLGPTKHFELIPWKSKRRRVEARRVQLNEQVQIARSSDFVFYFVLSLLVWLPVWFDSTASLPAASNSVICIGCNQAAPALPMSKTSPPNPNSIQKPITNQIGGPVQRPEGKRNE